MSEHLFLPLAIAAATVASLHSLAPDHWMPIAALARTQGWSTVRTARITFTCGLGHVTTSVGLGLLAVLFGAGVFTGFGTQLESVAGYLLIGFGVLFGVRGLRHAAAHLHGHGHHHYDHVHEPQRATPWTLVLVYASDPCVALLPLMVAAAPLGWLKLLGLVVIYEAATISTMVTLVLAAVRAARVVVRGQWLHRYGDAVAGGFIVVVGLTVTLLGW